MARRRMLPAIRGDRSLLPCIHVDDAASATVAALDRGAGRRHLRHRRRRAGELQRDRAARSPMRPARRGRSRYPSWLPRLVAPYMARMIAHPAAAVEREGARRAGLAAVVSDDPRRAVAQTARRAALSHDRDRSLSGAPRRSCSPSPTGCSAAPRDAEDVVQDAWLRYSSAQPVGSALRRRRI